jgi:ABC-type sugar transport system substrate-binding protein
MNFGSIVLVGMALVVLLGACSSSGGGSSGPGSSGSSRSAKLAPFEATLKKAESAMTSTAFPGPKTVTRIKAPRSVRLAIVACSTSIDGCESAAVAIQQAAKLLNWNTQIFNGNADPITQNNLIQQAANSGFNAIALTSIDPNQVQAGLRAAHAKGIPVGSFAQYVAASPTGVQFDVGADWGVMGAAAGAWFVVHTKGKGTLQAWQDKEFASDVNYMNGMIAAVKHCSTCTVAPEQSFVAADVGPSLGVRVVNTIQKDPSINVVEMGYDSAAAVAVSAIQQAALGNNVVVAGNNGASQNITWLRAGHVMGLDGIWDIAYGGYAVVDQMCRLLLKLPLAATPGVSPRVRYGEGDPWAMVDSNNANQVHIATSINSISFGLDSKLPQIYGQLWGVSS